MTDPGVSPDDMMSFPWRSRMDVPQPGDGALDALLARDLGPEQTTAALRPVAEVLAALRAAPSGGELAGLDHALAEFRRPGGTHRSPPRRRAWPRTRLSARLAGAVAVAVAVLSGGIAAAYAGVLPAALQKFVHISIAAPAASASPGQTRHAGVPAGPDPAGPAAHGLCSAYSRAVARGSARQQDTAFRKLAAAAGGAGRVAAYCATVLPPSAGPPGHAAGRPAARPVRTPPGKHKGAAASR